MELTPYCSCFISIQFQCNTKKIPIPVFTDEQYYLPPVTVEMLQKMQICYHSVQV